MKIFSITLALCFVLGGSYGQVSSETLMHNGLSRAYNIYIPSSYSVGDTVPLVFCLHGLGGTGPSFMATGFNTVADTANFIAVYPTATYDGFLGGTAWNCGIGFNTSVDDIGFMYALIDTISADYGIDTTRIHATGFSLGGFMTNRMGCEMSDRIASIASVAGLIGSQVNCNPSRTLSMMHMHGTNDGTITWDGMSGNFTVGQPVDTMINTWKAINNCPDSAVQTALPDDANDDFTIDHFDYSPCDDSREVELYRINGAGHDWMFTGNDVDSRVEIWRFFYRNRFSEQSPDPGPDPDPDPDPSTSLMDEKFNNKVLQLTPNPADGMVSLGAEFTHQRSGVVIIYDVSGRRVAMQSLVEGSAPTVDVSELHNGMYLLRLQSDAQTFTGKFVISR